MGTSLLSILPRLNDLTVEVPIRLIVDLKGPAAAELGPSIPALDLAREVLAFWDAQLLP